MTVRTFNWIDFAEEPDARQKRVLPKVEHSRDEVKVRGEPLSDVWWQGREWAVTSYGIEKRDGTYYVPKSDFGLHGDRWSWPEHVAAKGWADVEDFVTAWLVAATLHGKNGQAHLDVIAKLPPAGQEDA